MTAIPLRQMWTERNVFPGMINLQFCGRIPALDGLRGVAILMVMVAHFNHEVLLKEYHPWLGPLMTKFALTGLWGVELFFVLSGFLITGILLDAKGKSRYFYNFYGRRFVRIFPLYYAALFIVLAVVPLFVSLDDGARNILSQQWRLWLYMTNVPGGPGWDASEIFKLGHFWSLAVEEHFYLMWPLVVCLVPTKRLPLVCLLLVAIGFTARLGYTVFGESCVLLRWTTISKIDGLAVGALLAIFVRRKDLHGRVLDLARKSAIALGLLFFAFGFVPRAVPSDLRLLVGEPISIAFFAILLVLSIQVGQAAVPHLMRSPILVSFGKYSYGLYVIHGILRPCLLQWFPPATFAKLAPIAALGLLLQMTICIGICYVTAYASWHLYEKHFLKLKRYFESPEPQGVPCVSVPT